MENHLLRDLYLMQKYNKFYTAKVFRLISKSQSPLTCIKGLCDL
jgi:hypothetical protein